MHEVHKNPANIQILEEKTEYGHETVSPFSLSYYEMQYGIKLYEQATKIVSNQTNSHFLFLS
jgi:hypothetical protein